MAVEDGVVDDIVNGLVAQLGELYAVASAYANDMPRDESAYQILERSRLLLNEHGVRV